MSKRRTDRQTDRWNSLRVDLRGRPRPGRRPGGGDADRTGNSFRAGFPVGDARDRRARRPRRRGVGRRKYGAPALLRSRNRTRAGAHRLPYCAATTPFCAVRPPPPTVGKASVASRRDRRDDDPRLVRRRPPPRRPVLSSPIASWKLLVSPTSSGLVYCAAVRPRTAG